MVHSSERIYSGRVLNLRVDEIDQPSGDGTRKVEVVEHGGGVCVIAQPMPREIILVKQHRHAIEQDLWEVPAGMIEHGEPALETAKRELLEETGYRAESLRPLWSMYTVPGYGQERIRYFVAEGLTAGEAQPEADEQFELRIWPVDEAWALVERDEMRDAKTQIALAWARARL
ncbi:MAG: NUDIX hydrolase [Candidatus Eremiobacteraeota bacterium]|nr:NUDIX hydrolase [Candidatus Eremiobacteraeota bacterium]MBC5801818.1 NUDIX hydrolase [Candidatus Eremiobacteraeota bacterium]MBC5820494.1 NUDIX hydrolase [Candidatus Eremiobacteraeota bacterium]